MGSFRQKIYYSDPPQTDDPSPQSSYIGQDESFMLRVPTQQSQTGHSSLYDLANKTTSVPDRNNYENIVPGQAGTEPVVPDRGGNDKQNVWQLLHATTPASQGGTTTKTSAASNPYTFSPYRSQYQNQIDAIVNQILNGGQFSYDYTKDPLYQQYATQYNINGNNAMQNTLAQVAARTGGLASSYAGTAAQNAYNSYMQELNSRVPELYNLAYQSWKNDQSDKYNQLNMLNSLENSAYGRWMDEQNLRMKSAGSGESIADDESKPVEGESVDDKVVNGNATAQEEDGYLRQKETSDNGNEILSLAVQMKRNMAGKDKILQMLTEAVNSDDISEAEKNHIAKFLGYA